ncbi:hypothetical protein [Bradyrhizobium sp. Tv2a-2]|uniref:hypothetical protein n=1 Tax=Bradyrhizobium sp. Tv2a-2 TaxID=113395 RepID=UPI001FD985F9|nr:hypothetical protein [Bradyrhizobium sp. Tv2a-2]
MADSGLWQERRHRLARYQAMEREATDPLAVGLMHDIVLELEADLNEQIDQEAQLILMRDFALEPGTIEFHGLAVSCLVRSLSRQGASLDLASATVIPDRFTLALPLEGVSYACRLLWRKGMEIRVSFQ